jgi:lipopolysaccharide transport system ATP-binding protein
MADVVISVNRVSKRYRLGAGPDGQGDFRDLLAARLRRTLGGWRRARRADAGEDDAAELWALRDISFEVRRGEVVGLIGHNGAGKSTLLKILSRVTDPSSGEAWFDGRIGSLLEVGTGFHPELSGRENIFLSGAILGMSRREIAARFDEIVQFSEIGRFLDTPVKRYSSGMYVRLGFAVAAHLEPEILVIDEVLAVGDAAFQRKCMTKMKEAARNGRTILFVSHNMASVQSLCSRAIVMSHGRVVMTGAPGDAVKAYLAAAIARSDADLAARTDRRGRGRTRLVRATIYTEGHEDTPGLLIHGRTAWVEFDVSELQPELACRFSIYSHLNGTICRFASINSAPADRAIDGLRFRCAIPELPLVPGHYRINAAILSGSVLEDHVEAALAFDVEYGALDGRAIVPSQRGGIVAPRHQWFIPRAVGG